MRQDDSDWPKQLPNFRHPLAVNHLTRIAASGRHVALSWITANGLQVSKDYSVQASQGQHPAKAVEENKSDIFVSIIVTVAKSRMCC